MRSMHGKNLESKFSEAFASMFYSAYLRFMRRCGYLLLVFFASCSEGWTAEREEALMEECKGEIEQAFPEDADSVCSCYLASLKQKFPKGSFQQSDADTAFAQCISPLKERMQLDFERAVNDTVNH